MSIEDIRAISNLAIYVYFKYQEYCDNYIDAIEEYEKKERSIEFFEFLNKYFRKLNMEGVEIIY